MSRNTTETSTVRFSSSVALGFRSRSFLTASGTNFDSSPLSCSSSATRWRDSWRFWSAVWNLQERSEEHTSELQSLRHLVCRLLLEKKNTTRAQSANCPWTYMTILDRQRFQ